MKAGLLVLCIFSAIFCMGTVSADIPDLKGNWTEEKLVGVMHNKDFFNSTSELDHWVISSQEENIILGINYFTDGTEIIEEPIAGVISPDGKTVSIADASGGMYIGYVTDDETLTIQYVNTGDKKGESNYAFAFEQVLKKAE